MSNHEDKTEGDGCNAVIMLLLAGWGLEAFWNFVIAPGCHRFCSAGYPASPGLSEARLWRRQPFSTAFAVEKG
jgi:hypothetical protein